MMLFWAKDLKLVFIEQQSFVLTCIIFSSASTLAKILLICPLCCSIELFNKMLFSIIIYVGSL